jgi:hypothetical protein
LTFDIPSKTKQDTLTSDSTDIGKNLFRYHHHHHLHPADHTPTPQEDLDRNRPETLEPRALQPSRPRFSLSQLVQDSPESGSSIVQPYKESSYVETPQAIIQSHSPPPSGYVVDRQRSPVQSPPPRASTSGGISLAYAGDGLLS